MSGAICSVWLACGGCTPPGELLQRQGGRQRGARVGGARVGQRETLRPATLCLPRPGRDARAPLPPCWLAPCLAPCHGSPGLKHVKLRGAAPLLRVQAPCRAVDPGRVPRARRDQLAFQPAPLLLARPLARVVAVRPGARRGRHVPSPAQVAHRPKRGLHGREARATQLAPGRQRGSSGCPPAAGSTAARRGPRSGQAGRGCSVGREGSGHLPSPRSRW